MGVQGSSVTQWGTPGFVLGVQSVTLLSGVALWKNLNCFEFHFLLLEDGALSYGIEVYKYKVLSKETAYTKQLVNATSLMKVRQVWEKLQHERSLWSRNQDRLAQTVKCRWPCSSCTQNLTWFLVWSTSS